MGKLRWLQCRVCGHAVIVVGETIEYGHRQTVVNEYGECSLCGETTYAIKSRYEH